MERLELATRYRPIHISLLLVCVAPPHRLGNDLYAWERQECGPEARSYLTGLLRSVGVDMAGKSPAEQLADFQRRGAYLARLVECAVEAPADASLAAAYGSVLVKRIRYSYKPRHIALLDPMPAGLVEILREAGLGDRLVGRGEVVCVPGPDDLRAIARLRALFASCDLDH